MGLLLSLFLECERPGAPRQTLARSSYRLGWLPTPSGDLSPVYFVGHPPSPYHP
jgi:hypothetical protein